MTEDGKPLDLGGLAGEAESRIGDVEIKMLAHLVPVEHFTDCQRNLSRAPQRIALAADRGFDAAQITPGGNQQILTFAGAFGGEISVAADNQPLAGKSGAVMEAMSR